MTLDCLGLEYNFKFLDLFAEEHKQPEFLEINPMHNIPTMVDGDFVMNESRAIAAYLVQKYAEDDKMYPKDPEIRARVDQRLYFDMGVFYKAFGECVNPLMFKGAKPEQEKFDKLKEVLGWLDGFVADDKFAAGNDEMTIGDLSLLSTYSTLKAAELSELDLSEFSNVAVWFEKCCGLIPNYEKANGEGAASFGEFYKLKASE